MKKLLLLFLPCLLWANHTPPTEKTSTISKATVYFTGARIERTAGLSLAEGNTTFQLTGLSPFIDENSIQVRDLKSATVVAMKYEITYLFPKNDTEKMASLESDIRKKQKEIASLDNLIKGLTEEETLLTINRKILENENTTLEKLKAFSEYYRNRIEAINNARYDHTVEKENLQKQLYAFQNELSVVTSKNKERQGVINLTLHSAAPQQLNLLITYNVSNAGWFPVYDVTATSTKSNLDIFFKAHVYQDTGEDWNNIPVVLSTADPGVKTTMPEIQPHYLNFINSYNYKSSGAVGSVSNKYNPFVKTVTGVVTDASGNPLPGVTVQVKGTTNGTQTDFDGRYSIDISGGQALVYNYVGANSQEVPVYAPMMNVSLTEDANKLEEVVVTSLGMKTKEKVTGYGTPAVQSLTGMVPGLQIRGANTISGDNTPLVVIDGEISTIQIMKSLSEREIANIEVLKGAQGTALYGSSAANGVIVITTKEVIEDENVTTREYTIKKPQTIPSLMDVTIIEIEKMSVETDYEYIAAPVLNENVFLTAKLKNWQKLNLLPGESNIYFSGTFVGKSYINPYETKKELVISLGVAPTITVKRTMDNNFKSNTFMGNNRVIQRGYIIELQNTGKEAVTVELFDRVPISQDKEIKVSNPTYDANNFDEDKGILTWEVSLAPGEHTEKHLSYELKYPKGRRINME